MFVYSIYFEIRR